CQQYDSDPWTF
nr:immunoglobulin light chain junction region [Macaca mulatta]